MLARRSYLERQLCDLQSALRGRMSYFKATRPHLTDNFHPNATLAE